MVISHTIMQCPDVVEILCAVLPLASKGFLHIPVEGGCHVMQSKWYYNARFTQTIGCPKGFLAMMIPLS